MRDAVCEVLLKRPDPINWSPGNIENEVHQLIDGAPWWKIYDIAERLYVEVGKGDFTGTQQNDYERRLNHLFREQGVGWQMENGAIAVRGSEAFALACGGHNARRGHPDRGQ
jgi:AbiJ N-terminal domain 4